MADSAPPVAADSSASRGVRNRGGGGGGGGGGGQRRGNRGGGRNSAAGSQGSLPESAPSQRFSALGNPLPPLAGDASKSAADSRPPPPSINTRLPRNDSGHSASRGGRPRGNSGGGRSEGKDRRQNSSFHRGTESPASSQQASSVPRAVMNSTPWPAPSGPTPEVLKSSDWGDDDDVTPSTSADQGDSSSRAKLLLDRALAEKADLQKKVNELSVEIEKYQADAAKHKSEIDGYKDQIDKVAVIEKSYATLRQTRDTLEAERDALKKALAKAEKDSKAIKDDLDIQMTRYKVDVDALNAQVEYYKLELEEYRGGAPAHSPGTEKASPGSWLQACLEGSNLSHIADSLGISTLEIARINVEAWIDEIGFRRTLQALVFERSGEQITIESVTFGQDVVESLGRVLSQVHLLIFVPRRPPNVPDPVFGAFLVSFVRILLEARNLALGAGKNASIVLEGYQLNRIVLDQSTVVPVNLLLT